MKNKKSPAFRIWLLFFGISAFALILVFRLYHLQILQGEVYKERAEKQYYFPQANIFNRGSIFFTNKDGTSFPAALQKNSFSVVVNPSVIKSYDFLFYQISSIIDLDEEDFIGKLSKGGDYQKIASNLDVATAEKIKKLNLIGVSVEHQKERVYPAGNLASHALGFVGFVEHSRVGQYGIERYYENTLKRENQSVFVNFFAEVFAGIKDSVSIAEVQEKEGDVLVSIEPQVQAFVEEELRDLNKNFNSRYSGAIVINPKDGAIVAMASHPDFDPNNYGKESSNSIFINPLVENVYEMGSIIKALTLAAGLDFGTIKPESTYFDPGVITLNNRQISNHDGRGRGLVDMQTVLNESLNTGASFIVQQMGNQNFARYMFDFGLGEASGIDLPNEAVNIVSNLSSSRDLEYATASFGQGIALTPVSTARALSVLANGGYLINPHLTKKVQYKNGFSRQISYQSGKRVLKPETSEEISRMLVKTFDEALLGGSLKMENYSIAAKTGTAQVAKEDGRGYYDDRFLHTFFGYFPAFDAKFLVFLFTYDPKGVRYASESLSVPFMDIAKYLINYYEITPDR